MIRPDRFLTLMLFNPLAGLVRNKDLCVPILMYHSISHDIEQGIHPYYRVVTSPEAFNRHMSFLVDEGYQVISLDRAVSLLRQDNYADQESMLARPVVITFDDGFLDFYTNGFPILSHHGFTATVFLPSSFIDAGDRTIMGKKFLSWSHVRELTNAGITFGSHTMSHTYLVTQPGPKVEQELRRSKETIEEKTGRQVSAFSYPYAFPEHDKDFVSFMRNSLQKFGYTCAVTTSIGISRVGQEGFFLRRLPMNTNDDDTFLRAKMLGGYDWMHTLQYSVKSIRGMLKMRRRKSLIKWVS
jgi:peptidoglycan/xylan/chitin deacetylase (PgdA/CDA1 family)